MLFLENIKNVTAFLAELNAERPLVDATLPDDDFDDFSTDDPTSSSSVGADPPPRSERSSFQDFSINFFRRLTEK